VRCHLLLMIEAAAAERQLAQLFGSGLQQWQPE
jgi:hypothetical protein